MYINRAGILIFERLGPEFQCLKGQGNNSNALQDRTEIKMFIKTAPELKCLKR